MDTHSDVPDRSPLRPRPQRPHPPLAEVQVAEEEGLLRRPGPEMRFPGVTHDTLVALEEGTQKPMETLAFLATRLSSHLLAHLDLRRRCGDVVDTLVLKVVVP